MDKIKDIYTELDKLLDELDALEYDVRAVVYILEQMQETLNHTGSGIEMVFVWVKQYLQKTNKRLRVILNELDKGVMKLNKLG